MLSYHGVVTNILDCCITASEFQFQSRYYVHFRSNTFGKGMNSLNPYSSFGSNSTNSFLLQGWLWQEITHKDLLAKKLRNQTKPNNLSLTPENTLSIYVTDNKNLIAGTPVLEHSYISYVMIRDVNLKTCRKRWMIGRRGERGSGISVLAARHDDDDDMRVADFKNSFSQSVNEDK